MITICTKDTMRQQVESASSGLNTILYDFRGNPSFMYVIPKFKLNTIVATWPDEYHPAFNVAGTIKDYIYVGLHQACLSNSLALSFPDRIPQSSTLADARTYCSNKGTGWHLMSNLEWSAVSLYSLVNAITVYGNTNYGASYQDVKYAGTRIDGITPGTVSGTAITYTGSGTLNWRHNNQLTGISDMVGNGFEWTDGLKSIDGAIVTQEMNTYTDNDYETDAVLPASWHTLKNIGGTAISFTSNDVLWKNGVVSGTVDLTQSGLTLAYMASILGINCIQPLGLTAGGQIFENATGYQYRSTTGHAIAVRGSGYIDGSKSGLLSLKFVARTTTNMFRVAYTA